MASIYRLKSLKPMQFLHELRQSHLPGIVGCRASAAAAHGANSGKASGLVLGDMSGLTRRNNTLKIKHG